MIGSRGRPIIWNKGLAAFEMNKLNRVCPISTTRRSFSAAGSAPRTLTDYDREVVEELMKQVDMNDLKKFNPKLHDLLAEKPELILEL